MLAAADAKDVAEWQQHTAAEAAVADAEAAVAQGMKGAKKQLKAAEARLDEVLDEKLSVLEALHETHDDYEDDDVMAGTDDDSDGDDLAATVTGAVGDAIASLDDYFLGGDCSHDSNGTPAAKHTRSPAGKPSTVSNGTRQANGLQLQHQRTQQKAQQLSSAAGGLHSNGQQQPQQQLKLAQASSHGKHDQLEDHPPSFSRVDMSLPQEQLKKQFPLFPGNDAALKVTLNAGDMLYLPAGWFHEVTSYGDPGAGLMCHQVLRLTLVFSILHDCVVFQRKLIADLAFYG